MTYDAHLHDDLKRLPDRIADACGRALRSTRITMDVPTTDWRIDYTSGGATSRSMSLDYPLDPASAWMYTRPRTIEPPRKRQFPVLPVAVGHAVFFLALALAGWLR